MDVPVEAEYILLTNPDFSITRLMIEINNTLI